MRNSTKQLLRDYFLSYYEYSNWITAGDTEREFLKTLFTNQAGKKTKSKRLIHAQSGVDAQKNAAKPVQVREVKQDSLSKLRSKLLDVKTEKQPTRNNSIIEENTNLHVEQLKEEPSEQEHSFQEELNNSRNLDSLKFKVWHCQRCKLALERKNLVFGQGNFNSKIVFVGEGPGSEEDQTGYAFIGKAGKLLTQMIHGMGVNRDSVYICNVVKCRPPGNRNPENDEISECSPVLFRQLELIKPRVIVTLGNIATKTLLPGVGGITKVRGQEFDYHGSILIPTFHPSALLRSPSQLGLVWEDFRKVRRLVFSKPKKETSN